MEALEFAKESERLNVVLTEEQLRAFTVYLDMLKDYNQRFNLTAIESDGEIWRKHFLDSLSAVKVMRPDCNVVDVGSGAGFPGLPLAIALPQMRVTLVDSLDKRVRFLTDVAGALGLERRVTAVHGRAEDVGQQKPHREQYDYAISRAVAKLSVLAEFCLPLVRVGGSFIAMKGPAVAEERKDAVQALRTLGGGSVESHEWCLPGEMEQRVLVVVNKERPTPAQYPRRAGTPAKKPL